MAKGNAYFYQVTDSEMAKLLKPENVDGLKFRPSEAGATEGEKWIALYDQCTIKMNLPGFRRFDLDGTFQYCNRSQLKADVEYQKSIDDERAWETAAKREERHKLYADDEEQHITQKIKDGDEIKPLISGLMMEFDAAVER